MLGIGPEISQSVKDIYTAANVRDTTTMRSLRLTLCFLQVPIEWEEVDVTPILKGGKTVIPDTAIASVKNNTVALKGESLVMSYYVLLLNYATCRTFGYT